MTIPKYDELFELVLRFLSDRAEHTSREMRDSIAVELQLSAAELNEYLPSNKQRVIDNRIGWARTYLKKAGLISSPKRGVYRIEKRGLDALSSGKRITNEFLEQFESFKEFTKVRERDASSKASADPILAKSLETPDEALGRAYEQITEQLADEILDEVMKLPPVAFEQMVLDLMAAMGYGEFEFSSKTTPASGDEGIDGVIMQDKLGFNLIFVQVKHYAPENVVGRPEIQAFVGALAGKGGDGLFVTTSRFSNQAVEYAGHQHVILIDGEKLARLMIEHDFGVTTKQTYAIKRIDTDVFNSYMER